MAPRGGGRRGGRGGRTDRDGDVSMKATDTNGRVSERRSARTDRDGDVSMGATGARGKMISRGSKTGTAASSRGGIGKKDNKTAKPRINTKQIVKHITDGKAADNASLKEVSSENPKTGLDEIKILGIEHSKAYTQTDGGLRQLIAFLERKSNRKVKKSRMDQAVVTVSVRPEDTTAFTKLNGFSFAGAEIKVELHKPANGVSKDGQALKNKLMSMLNSRYDGTLKLLKLSSMGTDPEFAGTGMFDVQRGPKFFLALMTVCDEAFTSAQQKKESVESVSLASNELENMRSVASLAQTFPDLKNLDLSDNKISKLGDLDSFRRKFPHLEQIYLQNNPIVNSDPTYQEQIKKWYPCLQVIDGNLIRTPEEVSAELQKRRGVNFNILPSSFEDPTGLGEKFVRIFFEGFDTDRAALVKLVYDANSTFSIALNPNDTTPASKFDSNDAWMKKSRNLIKVHSPVTRQNRRHRGIENITIAFLELPATRHPSLVTDLSKWCIEGHQINGLPDPTGQSIGGVNGMIITVHGEFEEFGDDKSTVKALRSFDRVFTIGPGAIPDSIRVINDLLTVRAHSSCDAWAPQQGVSSQAPPPPTGVESQVPPGYGEPTPGKPEEQLKKEYLEVELMKTIRLKLSYAQQCLQAAEYIPERAIEAYNTAKAQLPPEAYF